MSAKEGDWQLHQAILPFKDGLLDIKGHWHYINKASRGHSPSMVTACRAFYCHAGWICRCQSTGKWT
ncbi:hypothetical protein JCM19237_6996 [Photobacterium aphoticum]|uniref:Uncharacterized protein n=1 Tax=Photobacterium aphoticum TaxID=754436 RepID=A0A090R135_9GAMM|nr:hypothetical protein JCM19237_6996 [Photobacterium aphoticum]